MKLTVLMDNNTYIDRYYKGEPAVSYYLEDGDRNILFDTAYSGAFMDNAKKMEIDISKITDVIISHGHNDHTGGLPYLLKTDFKTRPVFTAHPDVFLERADDGLEIGCPVSKGKISEKMDCRITKEPVRISENITFLGEIPSVYEKRYAVGRAQRGVEIEDDFVMDDSAVVYETKGGIYIITGCSHSGICNIIDYAKKITGKNKVLGIIGGLHLFEDDERTKKTIDFICEENIGELYPCHCTSFKVKALLDRKITVHETGIGLVLEW